MSGVKVDDRVEWQRFHGPTRGSVREVYIGRNEIEVARIEIDGVGSDFPAIVGTHNLRVIHDEVEHPNRGELDG